MKENKKICEFHGQGKYTRINGQKYDGEWKDGDKWNGRVYDNF